MPLQRFYLFIVLILITNKVIKSISIIADIKRCDEICSIESFKKIITIIKENANGIKDFQSFMNKFPLNANLEPFFRSLSKGNTKRNITLFRDAMSPHINRNLVKCILAESENIKNANEQNISILLLLDLLNFAKKKKLQNNLKSLWFFFLINIINKFDNLTASWEHVAKKNFQIYINRLRSDLICNTDIKIILKSKKYLIKSESEKIASIVLKNNCSFQSLFLCDPKNDKVKECLRNKKKHYEEYIDTASLLDKIRLREFFNREEYKSTYNFVDYIDMKISEILTQKNHHQIKGSDLKEFNKEDLAFIENFKLKNLHKFLYKSSASSFLAGSALLCYLSIKKNNFVNGLARNTLSMGAFSLIGIPVFYSVMTALEYYTKIAHLRKIKKFLTICLKKNQPKL